MAAEGLRNLKQEAYYWSGLRSDGSVAKPLRILFSIQLNVLHFWRRIFKEGRCKGLKSEEYEGPAVLLVQLTKLKISVLNVHSLHWLSNESYFQMFTNSSWRALIWTSWQKRLTNGAANILTNSKGDANVETDSFSESKLDHWFQKGQLSELQNFRLITEIRKFNKYICLNF